MNATGYYAQRFSEALASERPALAKFLLSPPRGKIGWLEVFEAPRPSHEGQSLLVVDRHNAIEIAWRGLPTRGPAEFHWIEKRREDKELVRSAVSAVISILEGRTTAMIRRYRFLWFRPWYLAWFRQPGEALEPNVVSWRKCAGTKKSPSRRCRRQIAARRLRAHPSRRRPALPTVNRWARFQLLPAALTLRMQIVRSVTASNLLGGVGRMVSDSTV